MPRLISRTRKRRPLALAALALAALGVPETAVQAGATQPSPYCASEGGAKLLCGIGKPEDVFAVAGTPWVITSSLTGGVFAINTRTRKPVALYPAANARDRLDKATYRECAGPPDAAAKQHFSTLGIYVRPIGAGRHRVFATRYPGPSGVDVFDLDLRGVPQATWIGCVASPDKVLANSIIGLKDGGFIVSSFYETGPGSQASRARAMAGEVTGDLWSWHPRVGWKKIPGTESAGTNGIEISRDGRYAYVNQWGSRTFMRVSLGANPPRRDIVQLDFRPDNLHWAPDGKLLIAGHSDTAGYLAKVDPKTLEVVTLLEREDTPQFIHFSGAVQIGSEYWVGSSRSDHIAIFPAPDRH